VTWEAASADVGNLKRCHRSTWHEVEIKAKVLEMQAQQQKEIDQRRA